MYKNSKRQPPFSSIQPIDRNLMRCYHSRLKWTWEQWQCRGTPHSSNLQHYWNLTIRLFSVIFRTLVGWGVLPLCREAVGVFYRPKCVCVCASVYVYLPFICVCVCVFPRSLMHLCMYVYVCKFVFPSCVFTCAYIYGHVCVCFHGPLCMYVCVCINGCLFPLYVSVSMCV